MMETWMAAERKVTDFVTNRSSINEKAMVLCESCAISIPRNTNFVWNILFSCISVNISIGSKQD